jgi:hypothetical protein
MRQKNPWLPLAPAERGVIPPERWLMRYPITPDGRYFVIRGRLWRCTDPALSEAERQRLTRELMRHRSAVGRAKRAGDEDAEGAARRQVNEVKVALGERGPVWWTDGAPDYNRQMATKTPYAAWYEALDLMPDNEDPPEAK